MSGKIGRNDLCPCGSGKKYKHCHMRADQEEARRQSPPPPHSPPPLPAVQRQEVSPEIAAANARWERFEAANLEERIALFREALASGQMDAEEAIEMSEEIRGRLDTYHNPADRVTYANLLEQLRQEAPDCYDYHIAY
jgi:hypothetical protein